MQVNEIKSIVITLTEKEASWLKAVMQNPLHGESPEEEGINQSVMRRCLFTSLQGYVD